MPRSRAGGRLWVWLIAALPLGRQRAPAAPSPMIFPANRHKPANLKPC
jgi:hypothetical protein